MLLFISQAMKADQACIVIFREKTAFRRYMICLFHVLERLGFLNNVFKRDYDSLHRFDILISFLCMCATSIQNCKPSCVCEDSRNNTFTCLRNLEQQNSSMYCEFSDAEVLLPWHILMLMCSTVFQWMACFVLVLSFVFHLCLVTWAEIPGDRGMSPPPPMNWKHTISNVPHPHDF